MEVLVIEKEAFQEDLAVLLTLNISSSLSLKKKTALKIALGSRACQSYHSDTQW